MRKRSRRAVSPRQIWRNYRRTSRRRSDTSRLDRFSGSRDRRISIRTSRIGRCRWRSPGLRILTSMRCGNGRYRIDRSVSIGAGKAGAWDSTDLFTKVGTLNSATSQLCRCSASVRSMTTSPAIKNSLCRSRVPLKLYGLRFARGSLRRLVSTQKPAGASRYRNWIGMNWYPWKPRTRRTRCDVDCSATAIATFCSQPSPFEASGGGQKRGPRPTLPLIMPPTGFGYMPLFCAAQWIATEGGKVEVDPADVEVWRAAFDQLLDRISSNEVAISGMRENVRASRSTEVAFAGCQIDFPFRTTQRGLVGAKRTTFNRS